MPRVFGPRLAAWGTLAEYRGRPADRGCHVGIQVNFYERSSGATPLSTLKPQALPMEFALEARQLLAISLEGSVG